MKTNETRTGTRIYWTEECFGLWFARYQPLSPKTGQPWQAARYIKSCWDSYILSNYKTQSSTPVIIGKIPKDWSKSGEWRLARSGCSTEALALAAIEAEKAKSGK